ncbi:MAG: HYC_CC_PP family protein [Mangrovibacterium sp.]
MIRKISHIAIALLFTVLTVGFTVSRHFCGDSLVAVSVFSASGTTCSGTDSACDMGDCCHNEDNVVQFHQDYTNPLVLEHVSFIPVLLQVFTFDLAFVTDEKSQIHNPIVRANAPPPRDVSSVLSIIQVYRL